MKEEKDKDKVRRRGWGKKELRKTAKEEEKSLLKGKEKYENAKEMEAEKRR